MKKDVPQQQFEPTSSIMQNARLHASAITSRLQAAADHMLDNVAQDPVYKRTLDEGDPVEKYEYALYHIAAAGTSTIRQNEQTEDRAENATERELLMYLILELDVRDNDVERAVIETLLLEEYTPIRQYVKISNMYKEYSDALYFVLTWLRESGVYREVLQQVVQTAGHFVIESTEQGLDEYDTSKADMADRYHQRTLQLFVLNAVYNSVEENITLTDLPWEWCNTMVTNGVLQQLMNTDVLNAAQQRAVLDIDRELSAQEACFARVL